MPRKPDPTLKPAIVEKVTAHLRDTKLEDVSIRSLGRMLGTSAYPIVYHFGTLESLVDAVVDRLSEGTAHLLLDPASDDLALSDHLVALYGRLDDPDRSLAARLAFELGSVEHVTGRTKHLDMHRAQVATIAAWCTAHGYGARDAERAANDAVSAARGAQWAQLVDPEGAALEPSLRDIAHRLVAGASIGVS